MKKIRKIILTSLGILPLVAPTDLLAESYSDSKKLLLTPQKMSWRDARIDVELQAGSRSIATLDSMIPFIGDQNSFAYGNLKLKSKYKDNDSSYEMNLGLGMRHVNDAQDAIYGLYTFYDIAKSANNNPFTQITIGAERLGLTWDFRANAYLPIGNKTYNTLHKQTFNGFNGNDASASLIYLYEEAHSGADLEIGRTLGSQNLRAYLGAYTFGSNITGPKARLEYRLNNRYSVNASIQHDDARQTQFLVGVGVTFGGNKTKNDNSIYSRLTDKVVRDIDIVTSTSENTIDFIDRNRFYFVDTDITNIGDGTNESPYKTIDDAIEKAPDNAIILIKGDNGTIHRVADNIEMREGQVLWGAQDSLYWDFETNSISTDPSKLIHQGVGKRQTIGGNIKLNNNVGIYNIDIKADDDGIDTHGIYIDNLSNVTVGNVNISGFMGEAINGKERAGIYISGENTTASLKNITVDDSQVGAIISGGKVTIDTLSISNSVTQGIKASNSTIESSEISVNGSGDIGVQFNNVAFLGDTLSIEQSLSAGLQSYDSTISLSSSLQIDQTGSEQGHGIDLNGTRFKAGDVSVSNSAANGVDLESTEKSSSFTANNVTITDSHAAGLQAHNAEITIENALSIDQTGSEQGHGLDLNGTQFTAGDVVVLNSVVNGVDIESTELPSSFTANNVTITGSHKAGLQAHNAKINIRDTLSIDQIGSIAGQGFDLTGGTFNTNNMDVKNSIGYAIDLDDVENFTANNVTISDSHSIGLSATNSHLTINGLLSLDQTSSTTGHGIDIDGGSYKGGDVTIVDDDVSSNDAGNGMKLENTDFETNNLTVIGSARFKSGIAVVNSIFKVNNTATVENSDAALSINNGDLMPTEKSEPDVYINNLQTKNTLRGVSLTKTNIVFNTLSIDDSSSFGFKSLSSNVEINDSLSIDQTSSETGNGIEFEGGSLKANRITVIDHATTYNLSGHGILLENTAFDTNFLLVTGSAKGRAGLRVIDSTVDIRNDATISDTNKALQISGADSQVNIANMELIDNQYGVEVSDNSNVSFTDLTIKGTSLIGFSSKDSTVSINNSLDIDQKYSDSGHGLKLVSSQFDASNATITVENSIGNSIDIDQSSFTANAVNISGGKKAGLFTLDSDITINSALIIDQTYSQEGRGLDMTNGSFKGNADIDVSNSHSIGIELDDLSAFNAKSLTIAGSASSGLHADNTPIKITGTMHIDQSQSTAGDGMVLKNGTSLDTGSIEVKNSVDNGITLTNIDSLDSDSVTISNSGENGIHLNGIDANVNIGTLRTSDSGEHGIWLEQANSVDIDNIISKPTEWPYYAIYIGSEDDLTKSVKNLSINNVTLNNSEDRSFYGIYIGGNETKATIEKGLFEDVAQAININANEVTLNNIQINPNGSYTETGIIAYNNSTVNINNVTINNTLYGIITWFENPININIIADNLTISNAGDASIIINENSSLKITNSILDNSQAKNSAYVAIDIYDNAIVKAENLTIRGSNGFRFSDPANYDAIGYIKNSVFDSDMKLAVDRSFSEISIPASIAQENNSWQNNLDDSED